MTHSDRFELRLSPIHKGMAESLAERWGCSTAEAIRLSITEAHIRHELYQEQERSTMNMPETLRWSEPGWYAPVQEQGVVVWYWVPAQDGPDTIPETRSFGLGTPRWFDSENEL